MWPLNYKSKIRKYFCIDVTIQNCNLKELYYCVFFNTSTAWYYMILTH